MKYLRHPRCPADELSDGLPLLGFALGHQDVLVRSATRRRKVVLSSPTRRTTRDASPDDGYEDDLLKGATVTVCGPDNFVRVFVETR